MPIRAILIFSAVVGLPAPCRKQPPQFSNALLAFQGSLKSTMAQVQIPVEGILSMDPGLMLNQSFMPVAGACVRLGHSFSNNETFTPQNELYTNLIQASWYVSIVAL